MSRIVIFANGQLTQPELLRRRLRPTDTIFCADGGTMHALALGLIPQVIVGDLDSLPADVAAAMEAKGVSIYRHPLRKDETDLELAFRLALTHNPAEIMLVTVLGGRLDQMLANILLLTRPEYASVQISLVDGLQWATIIRPDQSIELTGQPGDTLSLIPLTASVTQVNLSGVEWPLHEATLWFGSTYSISNSFIGSGVKLAIGTGLALLVHIERGSEAVNN
jgi:thiamine pyrophosphokinase